MSDVERDKTVWLEVTQYTQIRRRVMHYYGRLYPCRGNSERVMKILTVDDAKKVNAIDGVEESAKAAYRSGDEYNGFDTVEELIARAIQVYRSFYPDAQMLVLGNPAYEEHRGVLHRVARRFRQIRK